MLGLCSSMRPSARWRRHNRARRNSGKRSSDAMLSTKEIVGTHGVYNFKPGGFFGVDERARVLVQLQKGIWMLMP